MLPISRYTNADMKIFCYLCLHMKNNMPKVSHYKTLYFLRYTHPRYMKDLFTNKEKRENKHVKKLPTFYKNYKLHGWVTREFLGIRIQNFHGIIFIWIQTYGDIFKSAWVYIWRKYLDNGVISCAKLKFR